jgi:signal transduction histidine kinase
MALGARSLAGCRRGWRAAVTTSFVTLSAWSVIPVVTSSGFSTVERALESKVGADVRPVGAIAAASGAWRGAEIVPFAAISMSTFDAPQLARWQVGERQLPSGSIVASREPSLWRDYRREVLVVAGALMVQAALIAGLLYQRRERRTADIESRRSLALAAHGERQAAMAALTGSIAHELNQPLCAILHNAEAAELLVASNRASAPELLEILRDIRSEDARASQIVQRHRAMLEKHDLESSRSRFVS